MNKSEKKRVAKVAEKLLAVVSDNNDAARYCSDDSERRALKNAARYYNALAEELNSLCE